MLGIGHWEIFVILLVVLLLFGAKRIPDIAQGLGKGIREFRKAMREVQSEIDVSSTPPPAPNHQPASYPPAQAPPQAATQPLPAATTHGPEKEKSNNSQG